ncbi:biotin-dependent carboxyltransferase family protein [Sinorhizobium sp. BG8]|uniref:5-oxoprolinase subunit C family protein n=1 Tax=Sinorhizobium sp. BG8 TaxID=2613773 RepID=UPI00193EAB2B|nr:biotin-dependent carboxyltransferase family protein [Sinorhizobium sp. BG8]QRM57078.1 biotin-dependent carboxyltransferase family protein [Sinorhizobium sp. BG8]
MIEIVQTGPLNTVQDLGRPGYRAIGVSASGAMDPLAVRVGNVLLGNEQGAAAIEVQTFPFKIRFSAITDFAVTGADGTISLNGREVMAWCIHRAAASDVLEIRQPRRMARVYITVAGGVDVPVVMGSRSTTLRGGFGGNGGRPLAAGDKLATTPTDGQLPYRAVAVVEPIVALREIFPAAIDDVLPVRAIPAGEHELFASDAKRFWSQPWRISSQSDRTGFRLSGEPIKPEAPVEMRSHGVVPGVVQVPPGGEPIIQMSDANTAGGYPKIAGVIEGDLWRLGQARIGTKIQFVRSTHAEARSTEQSVDRYVEDVRRTATMVKRALRVIA